MEIKTELQLFHELSFYSLAHPNKEYFIHQHVVDAYAVQYLNPETKIIKSVYGLLGLCLFLEYDFTGKEVQNVHVSLSSDKSDWPKIQYAVEPIDFSIQSIMNASEGKERDQKIRQWCEEVWKAHKVNQQPIREWLIKRKVIFS